MAHAQKPDFVFRRNGRVHLNRQGRQFSRLLAAEVCASAVLVGINAGYTTFRGSEKGTGYPLHSPVSLRFPSRASPCAITFQLESTYRCIFKYFQRSAAFSYILLFLTPYSQNDFGQGVAP
jgi:hypothetical protein